MQSENANEVPELSLMEGGPGDALMKRLRLIRPELGSASARTAIILGAARRKSGCRCFLSGRARRRG